VSLCLCGENYWLERAPESLANASGRDTSDGAKTLGLRRCLIAIGLWKDLLIVSIVSVDKYDHRSALRQTLRGAWK
jgi:hypothetical protein